MDFKNVISYKDLIMDWCGVFEGQIIKGSNEIGDKKKMWVFAVDGLKLYVSAKKFKDGFTLLNDEMLRKYKDHCGLILRSQDKFSFFVVMRENWKRFELKRPSEQTEHAKNVQRKTKPAKK